MGSGLGMLDLVVASRVDVSLVLLYFGYGGPASSDQADLALEQTLISIQLETLSLTGTLRSRI